MKKETQMKQMRRMKKETQHTKTFSACILKEGKILDKQPNLNARGTMKRTNKAQSYQSGGNKEQSRSEMETRMTIEKINKTKDWFFEKINKIYKLLSRLPKRGKKKRELKQNGFLNSLCFSGPMETLCCI